MDKIIAAMVALLIFPVSFSTRTGTNFFHVSHGLVFSFVTFSLMNDHPQNWMNGVDHHLPSIRGKNHSSMKPSTPKMMS